MASLPSIASRMSMSHLPKRPPIRPDPDNSAQVIQSPTFIG